MSKVSPETYTAKDGKKFTAKDASTMLDIDSINKKCDNIVKVAKEGCKNICTKIENVEIGKEALCVADSSLEPALDEVNRYIKTIASDGIEPTVEQIKEEALAAFNKLQEQENEKAKQECDAYNAKLESSN